MKGPDGSYYEDRGLCLKGNIYHNCALPKKKSHLQVALKFLVEVGGEISNFFEQDLAAIEAFSKSF
jgi:hypothetical protein